MKVLFVFLLVLVFGVVSSHGRTYEYNAVTTKRHDEYYLAQQWPASFCSVARCPSIPRYFTVHGLWAQKRSGQPVTCAAETFDILQLRRDTKHDMVTFWPNLFGQQYNKIFWRREYNKHASCIWPFDRNQDEYFTSTLDLAKSEYGNVTAMLLNAAILPGTSYSIIDIKNAISSVIHVLPSLHCNKAIDGTVQLLEIYLCFDKRFNPLNCLKRDKNCPTQNSLISFPDQP